MQYGRGRGKWQRRFLVQTWAFLGLFNFHARRFLFTSSSFFLSRDDLSFVHFLEDLLFIT
jgi:hypothetical protein